MNTFALSNEEATIETEKTFKYVDKNNSGEMDYYEFVMGSYMMGKKLS
jgi:Ca2+-binding EF-hand superfamily protein